MRSSWVGRESSDSDRDYASLVSARELKEEKKDVVDCEAIRDRTIESTEQESGSDRFFFDKLKVHKKLRLSIPEEALVDHIFVRLEPQVQDYVEVRNPTTTAQLFEVLAKYEERYSYKKMQGSKNSGNVERRGWNESRRSIHNDRQMNSRNSEVLHRPSSGRNNNRGNYEFGRQGNQWFESRNELNKDDRRFDQSGNRVQNENFSRGDRRNI
ncbi:uncharacterized protein TNCV_4663211 [Trichonephila clavipes]|uniref:Uncharacterized protein n=1 Tax=Trichonephila clavipes TaxID=2585209 RepID=A0A8X6SD16_TRICX|nr:uncharacterized protein TNCV_4663211 [Trichonephila clavipes]